MNTSQVLNPTTTAQGMRAKEDRRWMRWLLWITGGIVALIIIGVLALMMYMNYVPANLDTSTTLASEQGFYRISYQSALEPITINQLHSWTLHVETSDGQPVVDATIHVDGDMPQHGHGLPTRPQVTQNLGNGDYLVEGLKFHMHGWWIVEFDITSGGETDHVAFNLLLN
ncbi:MAG: Auxin-binding protein [Chloroflexi bacterium]|nr:MAG: Auxin-binding protein [Chloroflexota bacterium]